MNYPGDGGMYFFTVAVTSIYPQESPIWLEDSAQPLTGFPLFLVGTKKCSVECYSLGSVEGERPGPSESIASGEFVVFPATSRPTVIQSFPVQAGEKSSECDQTCSYDLAAAFRLGPWCYTTCPNAVVYWDSFWSALMLECAQSKALAVKASQRLSVGKSAAALSWPLFALVSASAGLIAEIITDRPRDRYRSLCQVLALLIMLVLQVSYGDPPFPSQIYFAASLSLACGTRPVPTVVGLASSQWPGPQSYPSDLQ